MIISWSSGVTSSTSAMPSASTRTTAHPGDTEQAGADEQHRGRLRHRRGSVTPVAVGRYARRLASAPAVDATNSPATIARPSAMNRRRSTRLEDAGRNYAVTGV